jgi:type II secretory pathway component GspD/PulD (secretin)
MKIEGDAQKLSVFAIGVDAPELLTAIASRAGLKLVVDDTVSRRITISVKDRPAREVISSIAGAYGLAAAEVEGVTIISEGIPRSPSSYLLSDIDQFSTKYVDASNARNLLPVFLQDYVKVNSEQNAVVLSAPAEVLRKFRADIAGFDIPASQILVDLLLVELTDTGVDALNLNLSNSNSGNLISATPSEGTVSFRALTTLPDSFNLTLIALQEQGRARVRANPRIATVSGRRASIFVGRQRYIVTPIDTGGGQRNYIDAGVRLAITPYTGGEKQILVDVDTEVSTLSALDPITRLPEKSTRTANTKVRVNDGQTIVIGGMKQSETRDVRTRVPVLGNLPILGPLLFRSRNKRTTESELVLFITPRILSDTGHLPAAEEADLQKRFLGPDLSAPLPPSPPVETLPRFQEAAPLPPLAKE